MITIPYSRTDIRDAISEGMDEKSVTLYFKGYVQQIVREITLLNTLKACPNVVNYEDHCVVEYPDEIRWDVLLRMELLTPLTNYMLQNKIAETDVVKMAMDICQALIEWLIMAYLQFELDNKDTVHRKLHICILGIPLC